MNNSSWIKLDQSFSKSIHVRSNRNKRILREVLPTNISKIEDDSSQEADPCHLISPSRKKRKIKPLDSVTINIQGDSSNDTCDVEYNPDGTELDYTTNKKIKPIIPFSLSTSLSRQLSTCIPTSSAKSHSWSTWKTFPKTTADINITNTIDDSPSDSDESSSQHLPVDTMIDECSTDASQKPSQVVQTLIETEESITPPVQPFIVNIKNKYPKKRKVRMVKGGLVERLTKSLSKSKSNLSFWQHHRSAELVKPGTLVTVNRVENTYGRILIYTKVNNEATIFSLCSNGFEVEKDDIIEVEFDGCQPYKTNSHVLYSYVDKTLKL